MSGREAHNCCSNIRLRLSISQHELSMDKQTKQQRLSLSHTHTQPGRYLYKLGPLLVPVEQDLSRHLAACELEVALNQGLELTHILILLCSGLCGGVVLWCGVG